MFIRWLDNHGLEQGFAFTITHSEKDKDGLPRRRTYVCTKGRKYVQRKEAQKIDERNTGHHTGNCKFYVNAYRRKDNLVYITKVEGNHNHALVKNINMVGDIIFKSLVEILKCDDFKILLCDNFTRVADDTLRMKLISFISKY